MPDVSNKRSLIGHLIGDYVQSCATCGWSPVPVISTPCGQIVPFTGMCAVCTYGDASMINDDEWVGNSVFKASDD